MSNLNLDFELVDVGSSDRPGVREWMKHGDTLNLYAGLINRYNLDYGMERRLLIDENLSTNQLSLHPELAESLRQAVGCELGPLDSPEPELDSPEPELELLPDNLSPHPYLPLYNFSELLTDELTINEWIKSNRGIATLQLLSEKFGLETEATLEFTLINQYGVQWAEINIINSYMLLLHKGDIGEGETVKILPIKGKKQRKKNRVEFPEGWLKVRDIRHLVKKETGKLITGQFVNKILRNKGWQVKEGKKWVLTEAGKKYGAGKVIRWDTDIVVKLVKEELGGETPRVTMKEAIAIAKEKLEGQITPRTITSQAANILLESLQLQYRGIIKGRKNSSRVWLPTENSEKSGIGILKGRLMHWEESIIEDYLIPYFLGQQPRLKLDSAA
ncbi:hypothetical protein [Moorena sp. SIO3A2]|uniref:hypothetical protein n=1 Tax=Moorena sp. SIO3A2 TaxID=2607841 RepID=UPI0013BE7503|nr:hypothetical protein [Moorena sp. SIO3A2]NER90382.1 hypothetical protein [Moorena sp. SIO3A2]